MSREGMPGSVNEPLATPECGRMENTAVGPGEGEGMNVGEHPNTSDIAC